MALHAGIVIRQQTKGGAVKSSIVWLASYPKSGNTWLRTFLANYLANGAKPVPINTLDRFGSGDSRAQTYRAVSGGRVDTTDVVSGVRFRPKVLGAIVGNNADINFVKTHNKRAMAWGVDLIPAAYTRSAIYVMRNPLDMVLSYARHFDMSHERAVEAVCHSDNALAPDKNNVAQFLGSWSDHVTSWTSFSPYPVLVLRYEDMLTDAEAAFEKVVRHVGMTMEDERLRRAVQHSSFDQLKKQEQEQGFVERAPADKAFFAKGAAGHWRTDLDPVLAKRIKQANKRLMKQYGYWND